jgi:hypothetical protein
VKLIASLLAVLLLVAGCSSQAETKPAPASSPVAGQPLKADEQAVRAVLQLYFDGFLNKDAATSMGVWASESADKPSPANSFTTHASIRKLTIEKVGTLNDLPTVWFEVTADLGPEPGSAWGPGENTRWGSVSQYPTGWKINGLATSPNNMK